MHDCTAAVYGHDNLETRVSAYLTHGANGTARLLEPYVLGPWSGAGAQQNAFLAL